MKIKYLKVISPALITKLKAGDRHAQRMFFEVFADRMMGVCRRYFRNHATAEDALMKGYMKAFLSIEKLQDTNKVEAWLRRIITNECLMIIRKNSKMKVQELEDYQAPPIEPTVIAKLSEQELLALIDELPDGYRTVFNLYVIEGYKHREIADILDISINTSKSQLIMARKRLAERIEAQHTQIKTS